MCQGEFTKPDVMELLICSLENLTVATKELCELSKSQVEIYEEQSGYVAKTATCLWEGAFPNDYISECANRFEESEKLLYKYCPYCGGKIVITAKDKNEK